MPVGLALVDIRLAQRGYPVEQHAARIGKDDRGLETLAMIGGRRDLVDASSVKMIGPLLKTVVVDAPRIFGLGANDQLIDAVGYCVGHHAHLVLDAHIAAISLPEAADRRLCHAAFAALGLAASHFEHRLLIRCAGDPALDESADTAVFHGDVPGGADKVALLDAGHPLLVRLL